MAMKGTHLTEETKRKVSQNHRKYQSESTKEKISNNAKINPNFGMRGKCQSKESKIKMSQSFKGRVPWNKGKTGVYSDETKQKMGAYWREKNRDEVTKQKVSASLKGVKRDNFSEEWKKNISLGKIGSILSDETKQKIRESTKGRNMRHNHSEESKQKIREKRKLQKNTYTTSIEIKIQNFLKELGIEFFTHHYMKEIEHGYQCDILIPSMNLVIECDGDYWHKYPTGTDIDHIRTSELINKGFNILRLWEHEIRKMSIEDFKVRII